MTTDTLTVDAVKALRTEAAQHGDTEMVALCDIWMESHDVPAYVTRAIAEALSWAQAQR